MTMSRQWSVWLLLSALLMAGLTGRVAADSGEGETLRLGVFPYLSARKLVELYRPLKQHLQQELGRPVRIVSAPDFPTFIERVNGQRYELIVNAPHMSRMAQLDAGYLPILRPLNDLSAVLVVAGDSPVASMEQLRGKVVATPPSIAVISMTAKTMAQQAGLTPGQDLALVGHPTHGAAVAAVMAGQVDAAVVSSWALMQMEARVAGRVRIVARSEAMAPIIYLVSPRLAQPEQVRIQRVIAHFVEQTEAGRRFIESFGYGGLRPLEAGEMERIDSVLPALRRELSLTGAP